MSIVKNTIEYNGNVIYKSNAISSIIHCSTKLSTNRATRVFGLNDDCFSLNENNTDLNDENYIYKFIVIFLIDCIQIGNSIFEKVKASSITECLFSGTILKIDDCINEMFAWKGEYSEKIKSIKGSLCCQIKIDIESSVHKSDLNFSCKFPLSELNIIKDYLQCVLQNDDLSLQKVNVILNSSLLVIEENIKESHDKFKCKFCAKLVDQDKMRCHVAKHILNAQVPDNQNTCGYCGIIGCKIELVKTSGHGAYKTFGPKSNCKYYYSFSLKAASKITKRSPCTNRPIECHLCSQVYWSYNFSFHFETMHSSAISSQKFEISEEERKLVLSKA